MNIQQIEYALVLQKLGSFSRAANKVGLTQSAISQQVSKLEFELGFSIFDRQKKPIEATEVGAKFLERAQLVVVQVQQLREFAEELDITARGTLTIGIIPTLSPYLVPFFINTLQSSLPHIWLTIKELMTKDIVEGLKEGTLNGGIIATPISTQIDLVSEPLFYEKFFLYISYKHKLYNNAKIMVEDIDPDDIWLLNEGNCFSDQVNNMCRLKSKQPEQPTFTYRSNSIDALRRIVEYKGGLTFLPELATLNVAPNQEDMIKEMVGPPRAREISLLYLENDPKKQLLIKIQEIIKASLPKSILEKGDKEIVRTNVEL